MITTFLVRLPDGTTTTCTTLAEATTLALQHPGAEVEPVVQFKSCSQHRSYEAANCPICGTATRLST